MHSIELKDIGLQYGQQVVLSNIDLEITAGDFICLIGPSGSGKSSLLRLIAGLSEPTTGAIYIDDKKITGPGLDRSVVFQEYSLFPWMSIGDNIILGLEQAFPDKSKKTLKELALEYLNLVGLPDVYEKLPSQLSGGMRQRAAIARSFSMDPPILLMDEPFGALDAVTRAHLQDLVSVLWKQRKDQQKTIVFVTHDVDEALLLANKIVVLSLNPGMIKEVVPVDFFKRQNRENLYQNEDFIALRTKLLSLLNAQILQQLSIGQVIQGDGSNI